MFFVEYPLSGSVARLRRASQMSAWMTRRGFSLVELLVVLAIISILSSILLLSISGTKSSRDLANAAYSIQGALEQARTLAMSTDTYTWVGFSEEDPSNPGVASSAAVGQVVVSLVSSQDGTKLYTTGTPPSPTALPSTSLTQVAKLMKIPNVKLYNLSATALTRPTPTYQLGSSSASSLSLAANSTFSSTPTFTYPLSTTTPTYKFYNIIQFSPQGDATQINSTPAQLIEIGLCPSHGTSVATSSADVAAIQVSGIGGQVITYRP
jgi:prepilin-type N-terminal cleavage/methylation domain-containing protein